MEGWSVWGASCAESDLGVAGMVELELELALERRAGAAVLVGNEGSVWEVGMGCSSYDVSYMMGSE